MSPRTLGLTAGAVVILGGLVYLFVQVQADPVPSTPGADPPAAPRPRTGSAAPTGDLSADPSPRRDDARTRVPHGERIVTAGGPPAVVAPPVAVPEPELDVDFEAAMDEANKHYDHGDYESAYKQALANLKRDPTNVRMLRVAVSSACMMGDGEAAGRYQSALPERDQADMARRCERFEIKLPVGAPPSDDRRDVVRKRAAGP